MQLQLLDHDLFIQRNDLKEVTTSDIYATTSATKFSNSGLWSESIFGLVGSKDRGKKFGWIDLKCKVIHPIIYAQLLTVHPTIRQCVLGTNKFNVKNGILIESETGRLSGLVSFVANIKKIDFIKISKPEKKEIAEYIEKNKDKIIINKFLVYPAGIRDIHETRAGSARVQQLSDINDSYTELLRLTSHLTLTASDSQLASPIIEKIQKILIGITTWGKNGLKGKSGLFRANILKKTTDYSARLVIVSSPDIPLGKLGIPYHICLLIFEPFFFNQILKRNESLKQLIADYIEKDINEISVQALKTFTKNMVKQHTSYPADLHNALVACAEKIVEDKQVLYKRDPVVTRASWIAAEPIVLSIGNAAIMSGLDCNRLNK